MERFRCFLCWHFRSGLPLRPSLLGRDLHPYRENGRCRWMRERVADC